jgi:hypothetical protein
MKPASAGSQPMCAIWPAVVVELGHHGFAVVGHDDGEAAAGESQAGAGAAFGHVVGVGAGQGAGAANRDVGI